MLSLEAPAKRSREAVEDWLKGEVTGPRTKKREKIHSTPQFYADSAMYSIYGTEGRIGKGNENPPNDLVSLHPSADDDPISKEMAKSSWTFRLLKVSFGTGSAVLAKESLGQRHVRFGYQLCIGEENPQVGDVYRARGCDFFSRSSDLGHLGYSRETVCSEARCVDCICDPLWRMG